MMHLSCFQLALAAGDNEPPNSVSGLGLVLERAADAHRPIARGCPAADARVCECVPGMPAFGCELRPAALASGPLRGTLPRAAGEVRQWCEHFHAFLGFVIGACSVAPLRFAHRWRLSRLVRLSFGYEAQRG